MKAIINRFIKSEMDILILRLFVIILFIFFGLQKWSDSSILLLKEIIQPTWLNVLYLEFNEGGVSHFIGAIEFFIVFTLVIGFSSPRIGLIGDMIIILMGLITLSLLFQLENLSGFILKDLLLVSIGIILLKSDLKRTYRNKYFC